MGNLDYLKINASVDKIKRDSSLLKNLNTKTPVGYLIVINKKHRVVCDNCIIEAKSHKNDRDTPIFHINIYPYKQNCYVCNKELVKGQTEYWPELFN